MRNERNKVLQLTTVEVMMLQQALDFWRQSEGRATSPAAGTAAITAVHGVVL